MKQCKIVHINDGRPTEHSNGSFYFSESFPRMESELEQYLNEGYEVKAMVPHVTPGEPGGGGYAFYKTGFVFYLEREVPEEELDLKELLDEMDGWLTEDEEDMDADDFDAEESDA